MNNVFFVHIDTFKLIFMQRYVLLFISCEFCTVFSLNVGGGRCARYARASLAPTHPPQRHAGGARQLRRYRIEQHALLRRARCSTRRLRSACAPCSSGRAVVGTTPGASNLAALGDLHPTQSRHITCAAKPLGCKKLPPTATGTAAHIEGRRLFHTSRAKLRSALLMFHSSAPPVARRCGCVWVPSAAPQLRKRSASSPLLGTHPQPRLTDCVPNLETLPRWLRTFCSLAPHLCGFTAVVRVDACTLSSLRSARARIHTHNGSKVKPFLCGKAA